MENKFIVLIKKFNEIKNMSWVQTYRSGPTGVGATFEQLLGKAKENFSIPDFRDVEIKTKRYNTNRPYSLFSSEPDGTYMFETDRLRKTYGYPSKQNKRFLVLNNTISVKSLTKIGDFRFKLKIDRMKQKIILVILNISNEVIDTQTFWEFNTLRTVLERKLKYLAIIKAYSKFIKETEYFKYDSIRIYKNVSFNKFIDLLEQGKIVINFKIGVFTDEHRFGQTHNHGTSFHIYESDLKNLYDSMY